MTTSQQLIDAWVKFWNTYDLDQVEELFVLDHRLTYFSSETEGAIHGIAAVREHHKKFGFLPGGKVTENRLWLEDVAFSEFGAATVVTAIWFFRRASGREQRGPVTFVCVQEAGANRLAHLNFGNYLPPRPV